MPLLEDHAPLEPPEALPRDPGVIIPPDALPRDPGVIIPLQGVTMPLNFFFLMSILLHFF